MYINFNNQSWFNRFFGSKPSHFINAVEIAEATPDQDNWIRIVPVGDFPEHHNGAHSVTKEHVQQMAANFKNTGTDLLFDIDHISLFGDTRAAAWSNQVEARDDGLYAKYPNFTPTAKKAIENKEYRYFSPVYFLNRKDKKGAEIGAVIDSVGITNRPYMDTEIDHIGNAHQFANTGLGDLMSKKMDQLGLTDVDVAKDAPITANTIGEIRRGEIKRPPDDVLKAIAKAIDEPVKKLQNLLPKQNSKTNDMKLNKDSLKKLGLPEDATEEQVNEAFANAEITLGDEQEDKSKKDQPSGKDEPATITDGFEAKLNSLQDRLDKRDKSEKDQQAVALINSAVDQGKINPADKDAYMNAAKADFDGTKKILDDRKANSVMPGKVAVDEDAGKDNKRKENATKACADYLRGQMKIAKAG